MYIGVSQLGKVTGKTRTKIDDAVVEALKVSIETSADQYGVDLSE